MLELLNRLVGTSSYFGTVAVYRLLALLAQRFGNEAVYRAYTSLELKRLIREETMRMGIWMYCPLPRPSYVRWLVKVLAPTLASLIQKEKDAQFEKITAKVFKDINEELCKVIRDTIRFSPYAGAAAGGAYRCKREKMS